MIKKSSALFLALSLIFLAGCENKTESQATVDIRPVRAVKISFNQVANQLRYSGEIRSRYESPLGFRVNGKLIKRLVEVGSVVKKGQVLAQLDTQDLNLAVQSTQQQVISAQAELSLAQAELRRIQSLVSQKFMSESNLDKAQTQVNVAQAKVQQIQVQLSQSKNQSGYTQLVADRSGVVTKIDAEIGQVLSAGQSVIKIAYDEEKEVQIFVPENQVELIKNTADINMKLWANDNKTYNLKLRELSPQADSASRTYSAKFTIVNPDDSIRLGMSAYVDLKAVFHDDVIQLPITVLFENVKHKASVWLVQNDRAVQKEVKVVGYHNDTVLFSKDSLKQSDVVITAGVHLLHDNQQVKPEFATPPAK